MSMDEPTAQEVQALSEIDRFIHEPARLVILALLAVVESADFTFVLRQTGLSRGNLSVQMNKLEDAGYITIEKEFVGKMPRTLLRMTAAGRQAFEAYRQSMLTALNDLGQ